MKTYGTLTRTHQGWTITASPHVITRLKRLFNRASSDQPGTIHLSATADIALDLEWICSRYPLDARPATLDQLSAEADAARQRDEQIHVILSGGSRPPGPLRPTRALRDYQALAADLALATGRLLLADDVGLGKTTSAAGLFRDAETLPAVVVTLTHLATPGQRLDGSPRSQWARELNAIFPDLEEPVPQPRTRDPSLLPSRSSVGPGGSSLRPSRALVCPGTGGDRVASGLDLGSRLRRARDERGLTQEQLAEAAGLSVAIVQKLEQGQRRSAATTTLIALASALDVGLSDLVGKRPQLQSPPGGVSVLAVRDVLLAPELAFVGSGVPDPTPVTVPELEVLVRGGWGSYWAGEFGKLAAVLPGLVSGARQVHRADPVVAASLLAQTYQLVACLLVHLGRDDLAVLAAERGVGAAETGNDRLQWASLQGTYSWALLHQGRTDAAERHALGVAEQMEPVMSQASPVELTVWGSLLLSAMAAAAAGGREGEAVEHLGLARVAAARMQGELFEYQTSFGPTQVAVQGTHAYAVLRRPDKAIESAAMVRPIDLTTIAYGRHLVDVAQAHVDRHADDDALGVLHEANTLSPEWFRHQGPARGLVAELVHRRRRLPVRLRELARSTGIDR